MNKICTSLEQSKKLIELGIDRKTSDMYYWCGSDLRIGGYKAQDEECDIPAWSLDALLDLLPAHIEDCDLVIDKYDDVWDITYEGDYENYNIKYLKNIESATLIDAAFEMVCWLKENGKL